MIDIFEIIQGAPTSLITNVPNFYYNNNYFS